VCGRQVWTAIVLLLLIRGVAACSDEPTEPSELPECTQEVVLRVGEGTTPSFSWTPACKLFFLLVEPAQGGEDLWSIITPGGNRLGPPVRYGIIPPDAEELVAPRPLLRGTTYNVVVFRHTGPGDDDGIQIGIIAFTP
jgi:hypothetical protein